MANLPPGITFTNGTGVYVLVNGTSSGGTRFSLEIIPDTATDSNYKIYKVLVVGAKGARTFSVRQVFTNTDVVPVENGGTGGKTVAKAIENLGFSTLTTTSYPSRISLLGWKIMFGIAVASSTPGAAKAITFPEAFKAEAPVLILSPNNASTAATVAWYDSQTKTGFNLRCNAVVSCTWIAIG